MLVQSACMKLDKYGDSFHGQINISTVVVKLVKDGFSRTYLDIILYYGKTLLSQNLVPDRRKKELISAETNLS